MNLLRSNHGILAVLLSSSCLAGSARASDRCKADVDIKDICGQLIAGPAGFRVNLNYKVKIEDARPGERFDLVMSLQQDGCRVLDDAGRPVQFVVPLEFPGSCRDKFVFQDGLQSMIGRCPISRPCDVKVCAEVVSAANGKILDTEKEGLKFINDSPRCPEPVGVVRHVEVRTERVYCPPPPPRVRVEVHYRHGRRCR